MLVRAEYIWLDGNATQFPRSKNQIYELGDHDDLLSIENIPLWGFDGSSTLQAEGHFSDCKLRPVHAVFDPLREQSPAVSILVMSDVLNPDGSPHPTNTRVHLVNAAKTYNLHEIWAAFEQEYTLFGRNGRPLGFPANDYPAAQGPYYCGVGADRIFGRPLVEAHMQACLEAEIFGAGCGTNAEVMPGQWEFQLRANDPLVCADRLYMARWLLHRLGEELGIVVSFDPKPVEEGDWNGAGAHLNLSDIEMRAPGGIEAIERACKKLARFHKEHIGVYGARNDKRLTGKHETCAINEFRYGSSDRGASVRIPMATVNNGCGYLEDRRPAANMDPYLVLTALLETIYGDGFRGAESLGLKPQTII